MCVRVCVCVYVCVSSTKMRNQCSNIGEKKTGKTRFRYTKFCKYILSTEPRSGNIHGGMFDDYSLQSKSKKGKKKKKDWPSIVQT